MSSKLMAYTSFKYVYEHQSYLHCINIRKFRRVLHNLEFRLMPWKSKRDVTVVLYE